MVKKLFKHELKFYLRMLLLVWGILLGVALLTRAIQLFEQDTTAYSIISGSSITFYVIAVIVCLCFPFIQGILRFYKNLFTGEGYLSFTLPVTPFQHILVKVTGAVLMELATVAVVLLSVAVVSAGDLFSEILKAGGYLYNIVYQELGNHWPFYLLEGVLTLVATLFTQLLLYYTCIALGQLFKKNRVAAAVGVYFGYYFLNQVLGTILMVSLERVPVEWFDAISQFVEKNLEWCIHGFFGFTLLLSLILSGVYFLITHTVIRKKLNLE